MKTTTATKDCLTMAANKLAQSTTPALSAKEAEALAKAGAVPELKWGGDSFMYFPGIDIGPVNLLMPLAAVNPVTAPGVEPRCWLMGVAVHGGYAMAADASSAAAISTGTDIAEGIYYNSERPRYLDACPLSTHSTGESGVQIHAMLKTHLDNSARAKKTVHRLSIRHLAQMKQLATYSYREESEPEKVKFPLVGILDRYYDSRRLAAIADIIAYSIPAHCLNSRKCRIFMAAADSTANIPLTFKVWDGTPEEKPKLLCVWRPSCRCWNPAGKKGRQTISHGRSGKTRKKRQMPWTCRNGAWGRLLRTRPRTETAQSAYRFRKRPSCMRLRASRAQWCIWPDRRRSLPWLPCLPPCRISPPLPTGRKTGTIRPRQPVHEYLADN